MEVQIDVFIIPPPLQGILDVLDRVQEVLLNFTLPGTGGDREDAKRGKASVVVGVQVFHRCHIGVIDYLLIHRNVLLTDQILYFLNPVFLPFLVVEVFKFHAGVKDHGDAINVGGIGERIVTIHLLACKLHSSCEGGVICFSGLVVEVIHQPIHSRNYSSNAGQLL
jgi:hypothetical protein